MFVAMIRPKFVVALFSRLLNFLVDHFFLFSRYRNGKICL